MKTAIYVPGLGDGLVDVSLYNYASHFSKTLDKNEEDKKYQYSVKFEKTNFDETDEEHSEVAIISKSHTNNPADSEVVYKIYEYSYEQEFLKTYSNKSMLSKAFRLCWGILKMIPVFLWSFVKGKGLNKKQKRQSLYFFFILITLSILVFFLLPSIMAILLDNFSGIRNSISQTLHEKIQFEVLQDNIYYSRFINFTRDVIIFFKDFSKYSISVASATALLYPKFQEQLSLASTEYLCVHYYLKYGEEKNKLIGGLSNLVEKISESEDNYTDLEIHAHAFGSVIAIDALFPKSQNQVDKRVRKEVTQLLTIGCPFDFIRVYYPDYFTGRESAINEIKNWYNVNCELDVLSSNFRNDSDSEYGDEKICPGNLKPLNITFEIVDASSGGFLDRMLLLNFKTKGLYWDQDPKGLSFFTNYLNKRYSYESNRD